MPSSPWLTWLSSYLERLHPQVSCRGTGHQAVVRRDDGMSTAEYAVGTVAAVAFAGVLYAVISSDATRGLIASVVERALSVPL
jgi:uncharacterized protein DUF4244